MTKEEMEAEVVRLRNEGLDNINKYTRFAETDRKTITKLQKACHKWFMRWREAKKDAIYFDARLQEQIQATLNLQKENAELEERVKCFIDNLKNIVYAGDYYTAADLKIIKLISEIEEAKN